MGQFKNGIRHHKNVWKAICYTPTRTPHNNNKNNNSKMRKGYANY